MILVGETEFTRWVEGEEGDMQALPLSISWSCEKTELGDGRPELDWEFSARAQDDSLVELSPEEETTLIETLIDEGALA